MENTCVCCGRIIPEGRQVCPNCENKFIGPDAILKDGTHLYLKTPIKPCWEQLRLYQILSGKNKEDR
jgi:hypothetical protein